MYYNIRIKIFFIKTFISNMKSIKTFKIQCINAVYLYSDFSEIVFSFLNGLLVYCVIIYLNSFYIKKLQISIKAADESETTYKLSTGTTTNTTSQSTYAGIYLNYAR